MYVICENVIKYDFCQKIIKTSEDWYLDMVPNV